MAFSSSSMNNIFPSSSFPDEPSGGVFFPRQVVKGSVQGRKAVDAEGIKGISRHTYMGMAASVVEATVCR